MQQSLQFFVFLAIVMSLSLMPKEIDWKCTCFIHACMCMTAALCTQHQPVFMPSLYKSDVLSQPLVTHVVAEGTFWHSGLTHKV